jgi:DNA mismatch endonuclease (patch repair protein)
MTTPDEQRSRTMRAVRSKDTKPEMFVRRLLHRLGYRFRLHHKDLPGSPDIVFPGRRKVIFVHGCFWHGHSCKRGARQPKENAEYWREKIARNVARDRKVQAALTGLGWTPLTLWECKLRDNLEGRLRAFLEEAEHAEGAEVR